MKVLVTGAGGQLGYDVCRRLDALRIPNQGADIADFDLTHARDAAAYVRRYHPDWVVHCAAYTAVDKAESDIAACEAVNVAGTRNIARACADIGAAMVYISTDYVFPGIGDQPFEVDAPKEPLGVYGRTKLQGEIIVAELLQRYCIVRTSWVFGQNGGNFVKTMLRLGKERETLNVVCDQVGSPTYTRDLAVFVCDLLRAEKYGEYHATNEGFCSWFEFAQAIMREAGLRCDVLPVTTAAYGAVAPRPLNSRLSKKSLDDAGFARLPSWQDALRRYLAAQGPADEKER